LLQSYEGLKQWEAKIPANLTEYCLSVALGRLVRLDAAMGQKDKGDAGQKKLAEEKAAAKSTVKP
jgi:hypothetical protein